MMKVLNCLVLFLLFAINVQAQQFKTHAVKTGETLYSISKLYRVTPFNILKYNKEIKQGDVLKPNTILVIPMQAAASDTSPLPDTTKEKDLIKEVDQEQVERTPLRFRTHRVRKRETIYGISRRYEVSVDDIKRYNTELYSASLKKGMRLEIPVFPEIEEVTDSINSDDFETYVVLPKETRWSIAHKYGITVDSLLSLNPSLPRTTNHLTIGQELNLPIKPGSTVEGQEVQLFESYTVPAKKRCIALAGNMESHQKRS